MTMLRNVAFLTYEADCHCTHCATERFGFNIMDADRCGTFRDIEGNEVRHVHDWEVDSTTLHLPLACGSCGDVIIDSEVPQVDLQFGPDEGDDSCGCCGYHHPVGWFGDCRDDSNAYSEVEESEARMFPQHALQCQYNGFWLNRHGMAALMEYEQEQAARRKLAVS